jgi:hypothetical protein
MSKFLVTYHGAGMPSDPKMAQQARAQFGEWLQKTGRAVVDPGAPLKSASQVANANPVAAVPIGGYSIIEAPNVAAAEQILRSHPFVARGGTLQLHEVMAV